MRNLASEEFLNQHTTKLKFKSIWFETEAATATTTVGSYKVGPTPPIRSA